MFEIENENKIEKQSNFSINLFRKNIQNIAMIMFAMFIQNIVDQANTSVAISNIQSKKYFKIIDVGFFDSKLKNFYEADDVIQIDRDVYYRNVFLFVKKIKNAVITYETKTIRVNFSICLRDTIQIWYTENFNDLKKQALRFFDEKIDHWCETLIKKFRQSVIFAFQKLSKEKYFFENVKN